ncbi:olfactory receptor 52E4-like [Protopterus annectens]|uniref:olfactory receptor 52E4-like n=1 Tax=Protopterus annectens TaxID=7888 RepID=UPI001CFB65E2|nr:olfactory receptor 52E4-like [Protopterus annectens]
MLDSNYSTGDNLGFLLTGFPGLENIQHWFAGPFSITLLIACFGNIALLFIIATEQSLHEPMYYFIFMLSAADLAVALILLPKLLNVLWFGSQYLSYNACIVQLFFISFFTALESSMLVLMAYDRYVAVCNPLRYKTIMENQFVLKIMCFAAVRCLCMTLPFPVLANILPYCGVSIIQNVYCDYLSVIRAACGHTVISDIYGYIFIVLSDVPDVTLIGLSYYKIFRIVLKSGSRVAYQKAFNTCSPHFCVISIFYFWGLLSVIIIDFRREFPEYLHVLYSVLSFTVPFTLNPIIYGIKAKEIRRVILKLLRSY